MKTKALLISMRGLAAAALLLTSCSAPLSVSAGYGSVGVTVTIPAFTETAYPAALKTALSKPSRYIHPDTRRVEVSVAGAGITTPLTASAAIPLNSTTASLTVGSIPAGTNRAVTVSLYDAGDVLLAQSASTVDVEGGATASVTTAAVPIAVTNVAPGPYSALTPIRGADVGAADAGKTTVYSFSLPNPGPYTIYFSDYDFNTANGFPPLYGPNGLPVTTAAIAGSLTHRSFNAAAAGNYYVVLTLPTEYTYESALVLDADTRITASGPTLYATPDLTVFDRQRAFTLTVACGYVTGTPPGVLFGLAEGTSKDISATNGSTIAVTPGATGLTPTTSAPTNCTLNFTDALLNIARTGETFTLHAAPRRVIYLNSTGTKPGDSFAAGWQRIADAAEDINNLAEAIPVVVAGATGYSTTEIAAVNFGPPALVLGGCEEATWTRGPTHGDSTVNLYTLGSTPSLYVDAGAAGFLFDSLKILRGNLTATASFGTITVAGKTTFRDCDIRFQDTTVDGTMPSVNYAYLRLNAETELDRCTVLGRIVTMNTATNAISVRALEITTDAPVSIVNSIVSPGNIIGTVTFQSYVNGIYMASSLGVLNLAGSTIATGTAMGSFTNLRFNSVYALNQSTIRVSNSLLLSDNTNGTTANYALYTPSTSTTVCGNNLIAYPNDPETNAIVQIDGTLHPIGDWTNTIGTANLFSLISSINLGSADATNADYLQPGSASPLTSGGATLTAAIAGFTPSLGAAAFTVDRNGNARSAPYTIGAYEY